MKNLPLLCGLIGKFLAGAGHQLISRQNSEILGTGLGARCRGLTYLCWSYIHG